MSSQRIQSTKNYRMFERSAQNRPLDLKKHARLQKSMQKYGFLRCFPVVVARDSKDKMIVKDGQHRLAIAESLGLPVYWIEEDVDFDVAVINCTAKIWALKDYALTHANNGKPGYRAGLEFAETHGLPIGTAFALLAGTISFGNIEREFVEGDFKIKDGQWANAVASIYTPIVRMSPTVKNARFVEACMACCRVEGFDTKRLIGGAELCRHKLVAYSTRDAYLDMLEEIYNYKRQKLFPLKNEATMAMRQRSVASKKSA